MTIVGAVSPPGGDFSDPVTTATLSIVQVGLLVSAARWCGCALCVYAAAPRCAESCWGPGLLCMALLSAFAARQFQVRRFPNASSKIKVPLSSLPRVLSGVLGPGQEAGAAQALPLRQLAHLLLQVRGGLSSCYRCCCCCCRLPPLLLPSACCCCCCRLPPLLPSAAASCLQSCCMRYGLPCPLLPTNFFAGLLSLAGTSRRWSPSTTASTPASLRRARRPARSCRRRTT